MFTEITNLLKDGEMLCINIMKKGETLVVTVLPKSGEVKDPAAEQLIPLNLKGSPEELDAGFIEAIRLPVMKSTGLMTNMAEYEKSAEKAAQESKSEKDKADKISKYIKEAEAAEKANKHKEALSAYTKAFELDNKNVKIQLKINSLKLKTAPSVDIFSTSAPALEISQMEEEDSEKDFYPDDMNPDELD